ncbi:hypothetical protein Acid7E03_14070 [Acidisoma sp. 7E03]
MIRMAVVTAILAPGAAVAGLALAPIMRSWNHERRQVEAMLNGNRPYDQAAIAAAIRAYVSDASMVASHVNGSSATARDFADRFRQFAQTATIAGRNTQSAAAFRPHFAQLMSECSACHARFNN